VAFENLQHVDGEIGSRIRLRRALLGFSQKQLGERIGLTPQQVQKYEKGVNRIAASTLFKVAEALDVPVSFFFDEIPGDAPSTSQQSAFSRSEIDLVRHFRQITSGEVRERLLQVARRIGELGADDASGGSSR